MARFYLRVCGLYSQYRPGAGECQGGPPLLLTKPARAAKLKSAAAAACRARRTRGQQPRTAAAAAGGGFRIRRHTLPFIQILGGSIMSNPVRTRFAPSPTGYMHVG